MPQEFIPHHSALYSREKMFQGIVAICNIAEKFKWEERLLSDVFNNWDMPNEPILSEN